MRFDLQRFAEDAGGAAGAGAAESAASIVGGAVAGASADVGAHSDAGGVPADSNAQTATQAENTAVATKDAGGDGKQEAKADGVPESYDFKNIVPEGMEYDEASAQAFGTLAKECGLTQAQASKVAAYGMEYMRNGVGAFQQAQAVQREQWAKDAKTELGGDFDATVAKCGIAMDALQQRVPGLRQAMNETGAGNRIEVIRAMAVLGELIGEDRGHGVDGSAARDAPIYGNTNFNLY